MFAAINRFPYYLRNNFKLVSYLHCFFQPHSLFWTIGALGSGTIQLVISIDRYVAVCCFKKYMEYRQLRTRSNLHAILMFGLHYFSFYFLLIPTLMLEMKWICRFVGIILGLPIMALLFIGVTYWELL